MSEELENSMNQSATPDDDSGTYDMCYYKKVYDENVGEVWVCQIHANNSKFNVELHPNAPCLTVEPYRDVEVNVFQHFHSEPAKEDDVPKHTLYLHGSKVPTIKDSTATRPRINIVDTP